jgi:hypothetical protein
MKYSGSMELSHYYQQCPTLYFSTNPYMTDWKKLIDRIIIVRPEDNYSNGIE